MRSVRRLGVIVGILGVLVVAASAAHGTEPAPGVVTGETPHRLIHFTFDDGPDPRTTPRLLEVLDRAGLKATFFFSTSRFASKHARNLGTAALAREIVRRGHTAGSHSFDHQRMARLTFLEARTQIERSERALTQTLGVASRLFRPPFGSRGSAVDRLLAEGGYTTVMWNIGLADWVERPPEALLQTFWRVVERNEAEGVRGGVVLLHDTHAWSVDGFEHIAASLSARNCELLARGEELYDVTDSLDVFVAVPDATALAARQARLRASAAQRCGKASVEGSATARPASVAEKQ